MRSKAPSSFPSILFFLAFLYVEVHTQVPRLSMYAGSGYNVITGNPLTNSRDPGIVQHVF